MLMAAVCLQNMEDTDDDDNEEINIHTCARCGKETLYSAPLKDEMTERCLEDDCIQKNIDLYI